MITRLFSPTAARVYDSEVGQFVQDSVIPCHRCGICCERWQARVTHADARRLAAYLGISADSLLATYTVPYPLDDATRLLRHDANGCVFLRRDADGRSACTVHPARPEVCETWTASLARRECRDGLRATRADEAIVDVACVYPVADERSAFLRVIQGDTVPR